MGKLGKSVLSRPRRRSFEQLKKGAASGTELIQSEGSTVSFSPPHPDFMFDRLRVLSQLWSKNAKLTLSFTDDPYNYSTGYDPHKEEFSTTLPNYPIAFKEFASDVDRYRLYRFGLWHETQHVDRTDMTQPVTFLSNAIEDYRIEALGANEWKGMRTESEFVHRLVNKLRPDVDSLETKNDQLLEAFLQRLNADKINGTLNPTELAKVEQAVSLVKQAIPNIPTDKSSAYREVTRLEREVQRILDLHDRSPTSSNDGSKMGDGHASDISEVLKQQNMTPEKFEKLKEEIRQELKDEIRSELSEKGGMSEKQTDEIAQKLSNSIVDGTPDVQNEFKGLKDAIEKMESQARHERTGQTEIRQATDMGAASEVIDPVLMDRLKRKFRELRTGTSVKFRREGEEIDIERVLAGDPRPFMRKKLVKPRLKKVLILYDDSGSIYNSGVNEEYKKSVHALADTVKFVGGETAIYAFGGDTYKVKGFKDPWLPKLTASRLAAKIDGGNTSLRGALHRVMKEEKDYDLLVLLTDGRTSVDESVVKDLNQRTKVITFGIGADRSSAKEVAANLKTLGFENSFTLPKEELTRLPEMITPLVARGTR